MEADNLSPECRPTVLIVDDHPSMRAALRLLLETEGYDTLVAANGDVAVAEIRDAYPDVVILDLMMPHTDGWYVLENLPAEFPIGNVLVLSALSDSMSLNQAWRLGVGMYMTKPFDPAILLRRVGDIAAPTGAAGGR